MDQEKLSKSDTLLNAGYYEFLDGWSAVGTVVDLLGGGGNLSTDDVLHLLTPARKLLSKANEYFEESKKTVDYPTFQVRQDLSVL